MTLPSRRRSHNLFCKYVIMKPDYDATDLVALTLLVQQLTEALKLLGARVQQLEVRKK